MPYESPNIVIIPSVPLDKTKKAPLKKCDKNKDGSVIPDSGNVKSTSVPLKDTPNMPQKALQSEDTNLVSKDSVAVNTAKAVDVIPKPTMPQSEYVNTNSARSEVLKKKPCASWASNYLQSIGQGGGAKPSKLNILCTSNDSIKQNVDSAGIKKSDPPIKINLLSRSKVTKTGDTMTNPSLVKGTGNLSADFRPDIDKTWTCPPVPQTPLTQAWTTPSSHQQTCSTLNTGFIPRMDTRTWLTQQYQPNTIHAQNENINSNNVNSSFIRQKESEYTFTHYYTPTYKSPMDSMWLTDEYYAYLTSQQTNTYVNSINQCENATVQKENTYTKLSEKTSDVHNANLNTKSLLLKDNKIMKPNNIQTSTTYKDKEKNDSKTQGTKKTINLDLINLNEDSRKTQPSSETKVRKIPHKSADSKIIHSNSKTVNNKLPKIDQSESSKSKIEASHKIKEVPKKQAQNNAKLTCKKRVRSPENQTSKTRKRNEENSVAKIRKLTHCSEQEKERSICENARVQNNKDRGSKIKTKHTSKSVETDPVSRRKRVHRNSSSEYQPNKRLRRSPENINNNIHYNKMIPIKSVVKLPKNAEIKHPRIKRPESEGSDEDLVSDFDLRSKLSRVNYNNYKKKMMPHDGQNNEKSENERENLVITINRNEDDITQPKPGPSKPKQKSKKYKKIQLVINVICKNQDSSENSSSDENDSKETENSAVKINDKGSKLKSDLSFLDDINIDEIVNSLKHNAKLDVEQNGKPAVQNNTVSVKTTRNFVQPIVVKHEIKTEREDFNIVNNDGNLDINHDHTQGSTSDTVNLESLNSSVAEHSTESIANEGNNTDLIKNIKQEKYEDMQDKAEDEQNIEVQKEHLKVLGDNIYKTANRLISDPVIENTQTHTDNTITEVVKNIKSEPCEYDEGIVNEDLESQVLTEVNKNKELEQVISDCIDKESKILENHSAYEPMEPKETNSFKMLDFHKAIQEENNNDLTVSSEAISATVVDETVPSLTKTTKRNIEVEVTEANLALDTLVKNPDVNVEVSVIELTERISKNTNYVKYTGPAVIMQPLESFTQASKVEEKYEPSTSIKSVVKTDTAELSERKEFDNNTKVKIDTIIHPKLQAEILKLTNADRNPEHKLESGPNDESGAINKDDKIIKQNKEAVAGTGGNALIQSSVKKDSVVKLNTEVKGFSMNNTVESNNNIDDISKKLPQNKTPAANRNAIIKVSPSVLEKDIQQGSAEKNIQQIVVATTLAKSGIEKKESATGDNKSKNAEKARTVEIVPSLKSDKVLALKIEERILQYIKLKVNVTSLIHVGKFSKLFQCKSANGQQYAVKHIKNEENRNSFGIQKENMLRELQRDIPRQNLNTIYLINGFGLDRNWCFLMEYYPKNLREALRESAFEMDTVQELSRQLVSAVMVIRNNNIVHSDIRPSHILLDPANKKLKVCGFDESYYYEDLVKVLPNIGKANYRAPEVILGYSADFAIDVWTTALVMYEMVAGTKLFNEFPGYNNNLLFSQMCLLGYLPIDMIVTSPYAHKHFVGSVFKRIMGHGIGQFILYNAHNFNRKKKTYNILKHICIQKWSNTEKQQNHFGDLAKLSSLCRLLDKMLVMDPRRRIPIEFVYADPFLMYNQMNESTDFTNDVNLSLVR